MAGSGSVDDQDGGSVVPLVADDGCNRVPESEKVDMKALGRKRVAFALAGAIIKFKYDIRELIDFYRKPRHQLEADFTRQLSTQRAAKMVLLLFVGLDATMEPDDDQEEIFDDDEEEEEDQAASNNRILPREKPVSAARFVDRLHMRKVIKAFLDDEIDVDDESKDDFGDRCYYANFMSATGFVNRLWDVRRIVTACVNGDLNKRERRVAVAGMMSRLEKLLDDRTAAVSSQRFNIF